MATNSIPTHALAPSADRPVQVDHIVPVLSPVHNEVHRHDYDELFIFAAGSGTHMIDLQQHPVVAPGLHVVAAGQVHQLSRSADMRAVVVQFGRDALVGLNAVHHADLFNHAARPPSWSLGSAQVKEAEELVLRMEQESKSGGAGMVEVVRSYLAILLVKCAQWTGGHREGTGVPMDVQDPVRRFQGLVERSYQEERQVGHYADLLAMTPDHLNELVKKRLGRTASTVIHERLLLEAKRLLLHSDHSVKEVGYLLNMKDPAYFSRWFGKAEGMTPVAYRAHIREKYQH
ncbi:MAG: helix-turn-helix domain-containing protein [Flavobacteriales bacterium]